jgi:hypothetical protein
LRPGGGWAAADYSEPGYSEPGYAEPGYAEPGYAEPGYPEPGYAEPGYPEPGYPEPGYPEPGYPEPGYPEPGAWYGEPGYADPRHGAPGHGAPGPGQSGYADPGYSVLAVSDPAADVTSTQTWQVVDAAPAQSGWADLRAPVADQPRPGSWDEPVADGAAPAPAGRAGLTTGRLDQAGRPDHGRTGPGRPDTGGHRAAPPRPGSAGPAVDNGSRTAPPASPGPRTGRPHPRCAHARARGHARLLLAGALVVAIIAGAAVYLFLTGSRSGSGKAAAAARHSAAAPRRPPSAAAPATPALGQWGHIVTRAADPLTLSLGELFPASFSSGGSTYTRAVQRDGTSCTTGVIGSALQSALRAGRCTQVMRASYLSGDSKLMGTIGVLNLISVSAAERSGKVAGGGDFIAQLAAAKGPTRHLTRGTGLEETEVKGHYLVLVWAEFADLRAPRSKAQRLELETFCNRLIQNTANLSLASREITGKPRTP